MTIRRDKMEKAAAGGFTNATDLADYLVRKGMPFRSAHEVSGKLVKYCLEAQISLLDVKLDEFRSFSELIDQDIYEAISLLSCVNNRTITGAPSPDTVKLSLEKAASFI